MKPAILLLVLALVLAACASSRREEGPNLAEAGGWRWEILPAGAFDLAVARPFRPEGDLLVVYVEGDGVAYARPSQPAGDPTPTDPIALRLAMADPTGLPVAWVGRPCQYTLPQHGRNCRTAYWTTDRYAPEVVGSLSTALDVLKRRTSATRLALVGYSGGGTLAALLAARRPDVARVVTVAANLDLAYWTRRDKLQPLSGSLDPAQEAGSMGIIPQMHFTGGNDRSVGTDVVRSYLRALPQGTPVRLMEMPTFTHSCCWVKEWPSLASGLWLDVHE